MSSRSTDLPAELRDALAAHDERTDLEQLWQALGTVPPTPVDATAREAAWQAIAARTAPVSRGGLRVVQGGARARGRTWWAVAVAAAACLVIGVAAAPSTEEWRTATETDRIVRLADGTVVQLSAGTRLSMRRDFRGWFARAAATREVQLDGEAFFTVARDGRPFLVRTRQATVRVLGTRFDVRDVAGDAAATVIVEEGRVRVRAAAGVDSIDVGAGDRVRVAAGQSLARDTVLPARLLAWRSGGLVLVDQPIDAMLRELERRYGVRVTADPSVPQQERLTVYYPTLPSIETVLGDMATSQALRFQRTSRGYALTRAAE